MRKQSNRIMSEGKKRAKGYKCFYCNKEVTSFCNSHTIPAFCLKNISENGSIYCINKLVDNPLQKPDKGINNAGTFHLICRDCDSAIFQEYEDPNRYNKEPSQKMLAQIAMKNHLKQISKRQVEYETYTILNEMNPANQCFTNSMHKTEQLDLSEDIERFNIAKEVIEKNKTDKYYMFYFEKLDYVVPIAFQGSISLFSDLDNRMINDLYYYKPSYKIQDMHVCVFPLEETSIIIMFMDSNNKRYRNFYRKLKNLPLDEKLALINYIIFLYSEDVFLSKRIPKEILEDDNLIETSKKTPIAYAEDDDSLNTFLKEKLKNRYDLNKKNEIPNLLSINYKIK